MDHDYCRRGYQRFMHFTTKWFWVPSSEGLRVNWSLHEMMKIGKHHSIPPQKTKLSTSNIRWGPTEFRLRKAADKCLEGRWVCRTVITSFDRQHYHCIESIVSAVRTTSRSVSSHCLLRRLVSHLKRCDDGWKNWLWGPNGSLDFPSRNSGTNPVLGVLRRQSCYLWRSLTQRINTIIIVVSGRVHVAPPIMTRSNSLPTYIIFFHPIEAFFLSEKFLAKALSV